MTENEPTEEQLREFWGWCGLKAGWFKLESGLQIVAEYPSLDLNNLFQYAILKLKRIGYSYELVEWNEGQHKAIINKLCKGWAETYTTSVDKNPVLALFWAIWEAIHAK